MLSHVSLLNHSVIDMRISDISKEYSSFLPAADVEGKWWICCLLLPPNPDCSCLSNESLLGLSVYNFSLKNKDLVTEQTELLWKIKGFEAWSWYGRSRTFKFEDQKVEPEFAGQCTSDCVVVVQPSPRGSCLTHGVVLLGSTGTHRMWALLDSS